MVVRTVRSAASRWRTAAQRRSQAAFGTAALFVLVRKVTADKVLDRLKGEGGTVLKTSLDHTKEAALQAALAEVEAAVPASPPDLPGV